MYGGRRHFEGERVQKPIVERTGRKDPWCHGAELRFHVSKAAETKHSLAALFG
jgi:hypothetical protein